MYNLIKGNIMYLVCTRMCNNETCQYKYPHDVKHFDRPGFVEVCIAMNGMYHCLFSNCVRHDGWICFQLYQKSKQKEE